MDADRFDQIARSFSSGTRRGVLGFLSVLPLVGGLAALVGEDDSDAKGRHKRRKKASHRQRLSAEKKRKKKKKCKSTAQVCAGKCGPVTYKCKKRKKTVDCGSCVCDPPCPVCQICNGDPGICETDPKQQGDDCGESGQVCQSAGLCTCVANSCVPPDTCGGGGNPGFCGCTPNDPCTAGVCGTVQNSCGQDVDCGACSGTTPICVSNVCTACSGTNPCPSGCCAGDGSCQPGTGGDACGAGGGTCDVCVGSEVCFDADCCTPVNPTCEPTSCNTTNNCGQLVNCCGAAGATNPQCEEGQCCEMTVSPGSFCSATVPCCQNFQPGSRSCVGGHCCVNGGSPAAQANQCCSGQIQGFTCV